ncbi:hypothetical protein BpHYR1_037640 [Brachionus plicatilis]|uniref:Uncharacterized protein n=1 Tax=Brachionus plicatilis TaxID=10195 RepID=A0A3M7QNQ0_BRAPC|nr:hypothetical protein BpHYR1_037640 [Brachionus plicatilis]
MTIPILPHAKQEGRRLFGGEKWIYQQDGATAHTVDFEIILVKYRIKVTTNLEAFFFYIKISKVMNYGSPVKRSRSVSSSLISQFVASSELFVLGDKDCNPWYQPSFVNNHSVSKVLPVMCGVGQILCDQ